MIPQPIVTTPSLNKLLADCGRVCRFGQTVHNEEPSPSSDAVTAIKSQASSSNEATKSTAQHLEHEESSEALAKFVLCIPSAEEVDHSREEDGFSDTEEDSDD